MLDIHKKISYNIHNMNIFGEIEGVMKLDNGAHTEQPQTCR